MPTVRLIGVGPQRDGEVFVSLENIPIVLAEVRSTLPQLKKELSNRWRVDDVRIRERIPRRRNPWDPTQASSAVDLGIGIIVLFFVDAARATAERIGDNVGDEISRYVKRWLSKRNKDYGTKKKHKPRAKTLHK